MSNLLCFARFRSERERPHARLLAFHPPHGGSRDPLTPAQRAHRFRMLSHLRKAGSGIGEQGSGNYRQGSAATSESGAQG
jgi:hypothetical protein